MSRLLCVLALLLPSLAFAGATPPTVAVVPFTARGVEADVALAATDVLETVLAGSGQVTTVERAQVEKAVETVTITGAGGRKLLAAEYSISEGSDTDTLQRIAAQTGATYLLVGSVARLDGSRTVNARLSDAATGRVLVARSMAFKKADGMNTAVRTLAALLLEQLAAGPGQASSVGDAAQRELEARLARALEERYCGMEARRAGVVESFGGSEVKVRLHRKGATSGDTFELVGPRGEEKGLVTLSKVEKDGKRARGAFVNDGDSMALPAPGDLLRSPIVTLAVVPLVAKVALGRDPIELAQAVEDRLGESDGCQWEHQDDAAVEAYRKNGKARRTRLGRAGVARVVEWTLELSGATRQVLVRVVRLPGGKPDAEFTVPLAERE